MDKLEKFVRLLFLVCVVGYFPVCAVGLGIFRRPEFHIFSLCALVASVVVNGLYELVRYVRARLKSENRS